MTEFNDKNMVPTRAKPFDGISCVGSLLIFMLILFIMGTILGGAGTQSSSALTPTVTEYVSPTITQELLAMVTATAVSSPTNTPANTPSPIPTNTATATATELPTLPPLPPTITAVFDPAIIKPPPTLRPTPTQPPPPLPTPQGVYSWTLKVPILMYHYISIPPQDADEYRIRLSVSPDHFRQQMAYLAQNGYSTIDFYDLSLAIVSKRELPPKPVIVTMDDGYRDNYENAFPILQEYGLKATIFLATDFIDQGIEAYLTWPMVEEMAAAGIRFESHTKNHIDLRDRDRDQLIWQLLGSQETIAAHIGYTPRYLAYPSGRYDTAVIQALQELQFWGAVTTMGGKWHGYNDRYEWTRLRVRNNTPLSEFIDLVEPGDTVSGKQ